jgi:hypothetical protein
VFFNGCPSRRRGSGPPRANSIHNVKGGIFTRRASSTCRASRASLPEPGTAIYVEDLEAWEKAQASASVRDALFIRTGVWARRKAEGPWLRGRARAAVQPVSIRLSYPGCDSGMWHCSAAIIRMCRPASWRRLAGAVHDFALPIQMPLDNCDPRPWPSRSGEEAVEFLLTAAPLAIPGGTGSPLNPIAGFEASGLALG